MNSIEVHQHQTEPSARHQQQMLNEEDRTEIATTTSIRPAMLEYEGNFELHAASIYSDMFDPTQSNMIPVPNQMNAFFASGFNHIDPKYGDLERLYQTNYQMARPIPPKH